ncbi:MAG: hypothetical protein AAFR61_10415 [Bacteroidota bacterium]
MFDQFRVILLAFTGKLKHAPTIRRYFWAYLAGIMMALIILAYNAFMSLNFYRVILERFTPWESWFLPVLTTGSIAITVYLLMSSITGTILDYLARREYKTKGHEPMFVAVILVLVGFLCLDIYANLKGVDHVAVLTTKAVKNNESLTVYDKLQATISEKENTLNQLTSCKLKGYCWKGHITKDGRTYQQALMRDIEALRAQQQVLVQSAISAHTNDEKRFLNEVSHKQTSHIRLVWFAYPIAFLICFIIQHYVDRALAEGGNARGSATPQIPAEHYSAGQSNGVPIGYHTKGSAKLSQEEFLEKWKEAVDLIIAGHTNKEVIAMYQGREGQIRGTTIQKIKTVLRAKGILPEYQG